ncbi:insulin-like growth factor-binding protein 5-like [Arapaima gigas]
MVLLSDLLTIHLWLLAVSSSWVIAARVHLQKACTSCREPAESSRGPRDRSVDVSTTVLALGEPCGVYTLSCAKGLRCMPTPEEESPLQALLQGKGICTKGSRTIHTEKPHPTGMACWSERTAPCRRLLNILLQRLELTVFPSNSDIYIPNCDTQGFYRRKQCRSSKGMQRGNCWCVDEYGSPLPSRTGEDGTLQCDGE